MTTHRLSRSDFVRMRGGKRQSRVHGTYFSLATSPLSGDTGPKFACVVSTKVSKKAVERNRIKRLCREAVNSRIPGIQKSLALVFYAKHEAADAPRAAIHRDIDELLEKIQTKS